MEDGHEAVTNLDLRDRLRLVRFRFAYLPCRFSSLANRNEHGDSLGFALVVSLFLKGPLACSELRFAKLQRSSVAGSVLLSVVKMYPT